MSETMARVPADAPVTRAWNEYYQSEEYLNSFKWAAFDEHRDGSMWAAFHKGFEAALKERDEQIAAVLDGRLAKLADPHSSVAAALRALSKDIRSGSITKEGA